MSFLTRSLLSPAVLAHEAEGEFAAVGGGDGEEVGGRGTVGEVEGVAVGARGGEHHLFAATLHVGEGGGGDGLVALVCYIDFLAEGVAVADNGTRLV